MIALPLLEIVLLIQAGGAFGTWPVVAEVIVTAIAGVVLLRSLAGREIRRAFHTVRNQELPGDRLFRWICILASAMFLLMPGLITDACGISLLFPASRRLVFRAMVRNPGMRVHGQGPVPEAGEAIDAEYEVVEARQPGKQQGIPD